MTKLRQGLCLLRKEYERIFKKYFPCFGIIKLHVNLTGGITIRTINLCNV